MKKKDDSNKFRTTLFRNHRCTKEQNENKGNNIAIKVGWHDTMTALEYLGAISHKSVQKTRVYK